MFAIRKDVPMNASARLALSTPVVFCLVFLATSFAQDAQKKDVPKPDTPVETKKATPSDSKKVYRLVAPEKLEAILKDMKITYDKTKGKEDGIAFYDYEKAGQKIRLHNYQGKDLWIDAQSTDKMTLDDVNKWNVRAKFSRAVKLKGDKESVSLEAQLDCIGGVTDGIIRQFIERFDGELAQFSKFITK